jgi:CMP-N,N'-diacetyllegionaminic acid synthase
MRNLAIIPARSGSKGLKDKNIKLLNGRPMISYTIEAAINSKCFDEVMVSTDSEDYARISMECGAEVPFLREPHLSGDKADSWSVVKDVIKRYKALGKEFETVTLLQPTSPLRSYHDIISGYQQLIAKNANAIIGVCEDDHSPLWSNVLPNDRSLKNFIREEALNRTRQELPQFYRINGALYIIKVGCLDNIENLYNDKSFAMIMSKSHSVDIDDEYDFIIAEALIKSQLY